MELLHILNYVIQQEAKRLSDWSNPSSVFDTVYNYMFICLLWKRNIFSHQRFIEILPNVWFCIILLNEEFVMLENEFLILQNEFLILQNDFVILKIHFLILKNIVFVHLPYYLLGPLQMRKRNMYGILHVLYYDIYISVWNNLPTLHHQIKKQCFFFSGND